MIEFLGTPLLARIPLDSETLNLAALCGVSMARAEVFADALETAKQQSFVRHEQVLMPGMDPIMGESFSLGLLVQHAELDADTPQEVLLAGILIGRLFTEMQHQSAAAIKSVNKMIALLETDPAKAIRKMKKDVLKRTNNAK